jgi:hypothetical protein
MPRRSTTEVLEQGEIFFFYRPRVGVEEPASREDVQRLYLVLAPEGRPSRFRLFMIGHKKLPDIRPGQARPEERTWAVNVMTTENRDELLGELGSKTYQTKTRGVRQLSPARPVGEGRYELLRHNDHAEIAYVLELPEEPGPAQEEFAIKEAARYLVSVKNPWVSTPGFPGPSEPPNYPPYLAHRFDDRRWIRADDPRLLDYPNAQLLLIGAGEGEVESELGIRLDLEREQAQGLEIIRQLRERYLDVPLEPLFRGEFA